MLLSDGIDMILNQNVIIGDRGEDKRLQLRPELFRFLDFFVDFGGRELGGRPYALALALNTSVTAVLLAIEIEAILPLSSTAISDDFRIFPFERKKVCANIFEFVPVTRRM